VDPHALAKCWDEEFELLYAEVMAASEQELKPLPPHLEFYRRVALGAICFLFWIVFAIVFGAGSGLVLAVGLGLGVAGREAVRD
jgi:hypothetical protein